MADLKILMGTSQTITVKAGTLIQPKTGAVLFSIGPSTTGSIRIDREKIFKVKKDSTITLTNIEFSTLVVAVEYIGTLDAPLVVVPATAFTASYDTQIVVGVDYFASISTTPVDANSYTMSASPANANMEWNDTSFKAKASGSYSQTLTLTNQDGSKLTQPFVTQAYALSVSTTNISTKPVGTIVALQTTVLPTFVASEAVITYTSADPSIAIVVDGSLYYLKDGSTTITETVTYRGVSVSQTYPVTVADVVIPVTAVKISNKPVSTVLVRNAKYPKLSYTTTPADAVGFTEEWSASAGVVLDTNDWYTSVLTNAVVTLKLTNPGATSVLDTISYPVKDLKVTAPATMSGTVNVKTALTATFEPTTTELVSGYTINVTGDTSKVTITKEGDNWFVTPKVTGAVLLTWTYTFGGVTNTSTTTMTVAATPTNPTGIKITSKPSVLYRSVYFPALAYELEPAGSTLGTDYTVEWVKTSSIGTVGTEWYFYSANQSWTLNLKKGTDIVATDVYALDYSVPSVSISNKTTVLTGGVGDTVKGILNCNLDPSLFNFVWSIPSSYIDYVSVVQGDGTNPLVYVCDFKKVGSVNATLTCYIKTGGRYSASPSCNIEILTYQDNLTVDISKVGTDKRITNGNAWNANYCFLGSEDTVENLYQIADKFAFKTYTQYPNTVKGLYPTASGTPSKTDLTFTKFTLDTAPAPAATYTISDLSLGGARIGLNAIGNDSTQDFFYPVSWTKYEILTSTGAVLEVIPEKNVLTRQVSSKWRQRSIVSNSSLSSNGTYYFKIGNDSGTEFMKIKFTAVSGYNNLTMAYFEEDSTTCMVSMPVISSVALGSPIPNITLGPASSGSGNFNHSLFINNSYGLDFNTYVVKFVDGSTTEVPKSPYNELTFNTTGLPISECNVVAEIKLITK